MHDIHSAAHGGSHAHIMTDKEHGSFCLTDDTLKEQQDLRLHKSIKSRCRFIRNDKVRFTCQCYGKHHSLPHTAGQFERILPHPECGISDPCHIQQFFCACLRLFSAAFPPCPHCLCDLPPDLNGRVQAA